MTTSTAVEPETETLDTRPALLAIENLRVSFGDAEVVKGISFVARSGECLAIVGETGSGKSVTARTLVA